ncbi:MAG: imidazole glycerol phosphate synthase subunit HisH [Lachnospiraceae bacterium]|nr:imidazole glycerol phosphate synthase subunit HisH [Lachnospiraceae bacterium]
MIAIVDYGLGNLFSLQRSLRYIGQESVITADPSALEQAEKIILPGVGAFGDAAERLQKTGLGQAVVAQAEAGKPLLGICLGMQLLFEKGYEFGEHEGLGLIPGTVEEIVVPDRRRYKLPQMGWNSLRLLKKHPLFAGVKEGDYVYFVHSFHGCRCEDSVIAVTDYGIPVTAAAARDNVWGTQFHPEKSGPVGLAILQAFAEQEGTP